MAAREELVGMLVSVQEARLVVFRVVLTIED